jgi:hypothetical protein
MNLVLIDTTTGQRIKTMRGDWQMLDNKRGYNGNRGYLFANLSSVEGTGDVLDFDAAGLKARTTAANFNASGGTYIYIAFIDTYFGGKKLAQGRAR